MLAILKSPTGPPLCADISLSMVRLLRRTRLDTAPGTPYDPPGSSTTELSGQRGQRCHCFQALNLLGRPH